MRTPHACFRAVFIRRFGMILALQASMILAGCGGGSPQATTPVTITISTLPSGNIGVLYTATLSASGGNAPYTWTLSGNLPTGLSLNASAGTIGGTPASAANATALTVTATDSSTPAQSASATLHLTVYASVAVSPQNGAVVTGQALNVVSTTNDPTGVNWSATGASCSGSACGTFSSTSTLNGVATTWTAPSAPGVYILKAVSAGDGATSASTTVGVTDLAGISTVHYDLARDGANTQEYELTPAFVGGGSFGKLFSCTVDGAIYAEPLWVPQLAIGGTKRNVVFVATQHDSLYAFDADTSSSPCTALWQVSLIDKAHGAQASETPVPSYGPNALVGGGSGDIAPEVGVTGTPVIDPSTETLYVVSKSVDSTGTSFYQRLHAIDLFSGKEKFSGPATIAGTFPGTGDGGTTTTFVPQQQNQRPGLALANGIVYIAWSSHEDNPPYYGWVMGYDAATLARKYVLNISPNVQWGGIWMNGDAPPVDADGYIYYLTGNAGFDANSPGPPNNDFGDSVLKMDETLNISQSFTPSDQQMDDLDDNDLGSGGATLIDLPVNGTLPTHLIAGGGKDGYLYVLDRDNLGGYGDANAWQRMNWGASIFGTVAHWNGTLYMAGAWSSLQAFTLDPQTAMVDTSPSSVSSTYFGFPGSSPVVSSMPGNSNGIVWALENTNYCTPQLPGCGPTVLHAYQAGNLANELWNSGNNPADTAGYPVKFTLPTVANGRVYIGTRGNNTGGVENSTTIPGELDVYGPLK
ncbi:MAG: putative Ig domain-containing protein [Terracidiphilus sp.]